MAARAKGKQKADDRDLSRINPSDADDILSSTISTLVLEPSDNISEDDERVLEIATIAVIYPEFSKIGRLGGFIEIEVTQQSPVATEFTLLDGDDVTRKVPAEVSHLPPLSFEFQLPEGYPYEKPPNIRLTSSWLDHNVLRRLKSELVKQWDDLRDQAIFNCIDNLQSAADSLFGLMTPLHLTVNQRTKIEILEFDRATKVKKFNEGTFDCGICLEPRKGAICHRINQCGHVFCKPCLKDYFTTMIKEGDVESVQCLNYVCGKDLPPDEVVDEDGKIHKIPRKPGAIAPAELQLLVEADMVERFLKLKRKRAFEAMKNVVYCPRSFCKGPSLRDSEEDQLAICQDCSLAFCAECGKTWHGYKASCRQAPKEVQTAEEQEEAKLTEEFLQTNCTPCPTCLIPISKTGGCNHMYCSRCGTHFCLLCGAFLFPDNPYQHYSNEKSSCYNRLWEGVDEDGNIAPPPPPPPPPEEPPQQMMIQIVVPGQAPREVNAPHNVVPAEPVAGPAEDNQDNNDLPEVDIVNEDPENEIGPDERQRLEDDKHRPNLSEDDEAEFWVTYSRNECFCEGYNMLEAELSLTEIADFLRDWAASINQNRKNKLGLGAYWRRLIEWRRSVRAPRLKSKNMDVEEYQFSDDAVRAARQTWMNGEKDLIRRWWEIWHGGMRQLAANQDWDEDELYGRNDAQEALELLNGGSSSNA